MRSIIGFHMCGRQRQTCGAGTNKSSCVEVSFGSTISFEARGEIIHELSETGSSPQLFLRLARRLGSPAPARPRRRRSVFWNAMWRRASVSSLRRVGRFPAASPALMRRRIIMSARSPILACRSARPDRAASSGACSRRRANSATARSPATTRRECQCFAGSWRRRQCARRRQRRFGRPAAPLRQHADGVDITAGHHRPEAGAGAGPALKADRN